MTLIVPSGVKVTSPLEALLTVAVLLEVVAVSVVIVPSGVYEPEAETVPLENVGCDTEPAGV